MYLSAAGIFIAELRLISEGNRYAQRDTRLAHYDIAGANNQFVLLTVAYYQPQQVISQRRVLPTFTLNKVVGGVYI